MTKLFRAEFVLPYFTGDISDISMNTLHVIGADTVTKEEVLEHLADSWLAQFWHVVYPPGTPANRAAYVNWQAAYMRVFDLAEPTPRVPVQATMGWTNQGSFAPTTPTEVAMCLSFSAAPEPGVPGARLRGRIFLPCVSALTNPQASSLTTFPTFSSSAQTTIVNAFVDALELNTAFVAVCQVGLGPGGTKAARPIASVWADNSPDTQRRRSVSPTARSQDLGGPWGSFPS